MNDEIFLDEDLLFEAVFSLITINLEEGEMKPKKFAKVRSKLSKAYDVERFLSKKFNYFDRDKIAFIKREIKADPECRNYLDQLEKNINSINPPKDTIKNIWRNFKLRIKEMELGKKYKAEKGEEEMQNIARKSNYTPMNEAERKLIYEACKFVKNERLISEGKYYHTCPDCGANLDPGEKCDCQKEKKNVSEAGKDFGKAYENGGKDLDDYLDKSSAKWVRKGMSKADADEKARV